MEQKLQDNNMKEVWDCMKSITGLKKSSSSVGGDLDRANQLNHFYNRFDCPSTSPHPTSLPVQHSPPPSLDIAPLPHMATTNKEVKTTSVNSHQTHRPQMLPPPSFPPPSSLLIRHRTSPHMVTTSSATTLASANGHQSLATRQPSQKHPSSSSPSTRLIPPIISADQDALSEISAVVYVDILEGEAEGHVRFKTAEDAHAVMAAQAQLHKKHHWRLEILSDPKEQSFP
ncbi:hypothetical protein AALO_G00302810 [Alosa alosa]|uniref:XRRM domain-containing protein n=1 Tax=Alosa alosa TaxID=278164 RepID=A0AAV6FEW0_9TELE|nr:hypothetical protein AALO_G00302810 [Alosa alosa]